MKGKYSLMIHGGAGFIQGLDSELEKKYLLSIKKILEVGEDLLKLGKPSLEVVEKCVTMLENDSLYNAGKGSVFNSEGKIEMDAAIMNGLDMSAGAVAGVKNIKNPIKLAKLVMEKSEHVFLIGKGAEDFAALHKVETAEDEYFFTEFRYKQLEEARKQDKVVLDHDSVKENKFGTVGAVAYDQDGNLAAATSTGGITNKKFGRVGDSPIIGAGVYADNQSCAVSATGFGEQFIRTVISKTVADLVYLKGLGAQSAADQGINYLVEKVKGLGGVIVVDKDGYCGCSYSTKGMIRGWVKSGEQMQVKVIN